MKMKCTYLDGLISRVFLFVNHFKFVCSQFVFDNDPFSLIDCLIEIAVMIKKEKNKTLINVFEIYWR